MKRIDWPTVRADFPVLQQTVRGRTLAYLDNAATTQKPVAVIRALCEYYGTCNANVHRAVHYLAEEATRRYEATRARLARFLGAAGPEEIVFTRGATEGVNLVAHGWGRKFLRPGDAILLSVMEHHSNLVPWQLLARERGLALRFLPVTPGGELDLTGLDAALAPPVRFAAISGASNVLGTVNPIARIGATARARGVPLLVDGAQLAPNRAVNLAELNADFFVCSAHKMCGPTGVGALWARSDRLTQMNPFLGGGEMISRVTLEESDWADGPHKFEAGTPPIADAIAWGAALDYLDALGMGAVCAREKELAQAARAAFAEIPGLRLLDGGPDRTGAVSFVCADIHPHDLGQFLDSRGVAIRAGHLCAQPLLRHYGLTAVNRASFYFYNDESDLTAAADALRAAHSYFA